MCVSVLSFYYLMSNMQSSPYGANLLWITHYMSYSYLSIYSSIPIHTYIHICWFDFDALAQGNAYKPTKEPINYRGPGGDRTHDLQTEATPPAASCPARTLHATVIAPKNATYMHTYMHTCIHTYAHTHMHTYIHTYRQTYIEFEFHSTCQAEFLVTSTIAKCLHQG